MCIPVAAVLFFYDFVTVASDGGRCKTEPMKLDRDDIAAITGICAGSALLLLLFVACLVGNKLWERYQNRLEPAEDRPNVTYEATYWVSCTFTKFMKMCPHAEDHTHRYLRIRACDQQHDNAEIRFNLDEFKNPVVTQPAEAAAVLAANGRLPPGNDASVAPLERDESACELQQADDAQIEPSENPEAEGKGQDLMMTSACEIITPAAVCLGTLLVTRTHMTFQPDAQRSLLLKTVAHDATALALLCSGDREWETKALQQVRRQRYLNQDTALEMVFADDQPHGGTVLFNFPHSSQGSGCEDSSEVSI